MTVLLIIHDNNNHLSHFPIGVAYISSVFKKENADVHIFNQAIEHFTDEALKQKIEQLCPDVVGIGCVAGYYPYRALLKLSKIINECSNRSHFKYIVGGHMASASPEFILRKTQADIAVIGEAEETIKQLISSNFKDDTVKGTAWRNKVNEPRDLIQDLDSLSWPAYELFPIDIYRLQRQANILPHEFSMSMITGRGCTFHCTFCYRLMKGMRLRSIPAIIEEMKYLKERYNISYIDFADDLTMVSKQRAFELCEAILKADLKMKWRCEGRLNYASKDILEVMKKAGCVFINYGIESLDDKVLKNMNKCLTSKQIIDGVEETLKLGISPGLNIIFGNIGDNKETLEKSVDFLLKYNDHSQLRTISPVTPYPGCELFETAVKNGQIKDVEDFYENKHVNSDLITVNFTELKDEEFYECLYKANKVLLEKNTDVMKSKYNEKLKKLYVNQDASFRGWRHS